ncbi:MAG: hypothetical protein LBN30_06280, partial [Oscillospiraceae bacterium]|nr:hypothetical protein [Oscillospiraceae bacterium]
GQSYFWGEGDLQPNIADFDIKNSARKYEKCNLFCNKTHSVRNAYFFVTFVTKIDYFQQKSEDRVR